MFFQIQEPDLFPRISVEKAAQYGTLMGIKLDQYQACTNKMCYNVKLTETFNYLTCPACKRKYDRKENNYAEARIDVKSRKRKIVKLIVFWPQLVRLFKLFNRKIRLNDKEDDIVEAFLNLDKEKKGVKYYSCGNVQKFELP